MTEHEDGVRLRRRTIAGLAFGSLAVGIFSGGALGVRGSTLRSPLSSTFAPSTVNLVIDQYGRVNPFLQSNDIVHWYSWDQGSGQFAPATNVAFRPDVPSPCKNNGEPANGTCTISVAASGWYPSHCGGEACDPTMPMGSANVPLPSVAPPTPFERLVNLFARCFGWASEAQVMTLSSKPDRTDVPMIAKSGGQGGPKPHTLIPPLGRGEMVRALVENESTPAQFKVEVRADTAEYADMCPSTASGTDTECTDATDHLLKVRDQALLVWDGVGVNSGWAVTDDSAFAGGKANEVQLTAACNAPAGSTLLFAATAQQSAGVCPISKPPLAAGSPAGTHIIVHYMICDSNPCTTAAHKQTGLRFKIH